MEKLQAPFLWKDRRIVYQNGVWHVPALYDKFEEFSFPGWQDKTFFGNENPVNIEYCSGNGAWIIEKALNNPQINWVAIERKFARVRKIWSKAKSHQLANLIIICGEGFAVSKHYLQHNSINQVFINFPDPWPKTRHAKNRLMQTPFAKELARILKPNGSVTYVTDDIPHSEWTIQILNRESNFKSLYDPPYYITEDLQYGTSYFEELWREKGKTIRYHRFVKQ